MNPSSIDIWRDETFVSQSGMDASIKAMKKASLEVSPHDGKVSAASSYLIRHTANRLGSRLYFNEMKCNDNNILVQQQQQQQEEDEEEEVCVSSYFHDLDDGDEDALSDNIIEDDGVEDDDGFRSYSVSQRKTAPKLVKKSTSKSHKRKHVRTASIHDAKSKVKNKDIAKSLTQLQIVQSRNLYMNVAEQELLKTVLKLLFGVAQLSETSVDAATAPNSKRIKDAVLSVFNSSVDDIINTNHPMAPHIRQRSKLIILKNAKYLIKDDTNWRQCIESLRTGITKATMFDIVKIKVGCVNNTAVATATAGADATGDVVVKQTTGVDYKDGDIVEVKHKCGNWFQGVINETKTTPKTRSRKEKTQFFIKFDDGEKAWVTLVADEFRKSFATGDTGVNQTAMTAGGANTEVNHIGTLTVDYDIRSNSATTIITAVKSTDTAVTIGEDIPDANFADADDADMTNKAQAAI